MTEIFADVSESFKTRTACAFDLAARQKNIVKMVNLLKEYTEYCITDDEKDFVEFYFNLKMEQMKNESNSNKR